MSPSCASGSAPVPASFRGRGWRSLLRHGRLGLARPRRGWLGLRPRRGRRVRRRDLRGDRQPDDAVFPVPPCLSGGAWASSTRSDAARGGRRPRGAQSRVGGGGARHGVAGRSGACGVARRRGGQGRRAPRRRGEGARRGHRRAAVDHAPAARPRTAGDEAGATWLRACRGADGLTGWLSTTGTGNSSRHRRFGEGVGRCVASRAPDLPMSRVKSVGAPSWRVTWRRRWRPGRPGAARSSPADVTRRRPRPAPRPRPGRRGRGDRRAQGGPGRGRRRDARRDRRGARDQRRGVRPRVRAEGRRVSSERRPPGGGLPAPFLSDRDVVVHRVPPRLRPRPAAGGARTLPAGPTARRPARHDDRRRDLPTVASSWPATGAPPWATSSPSATSRRSSRPTSSPAWASPAPPASRSSWSGCSRSSSSTTRRSRARRCPSTARPTGWPR